MTELERTKDDPRLPKWEFLKNSWLRRIAIWTVPPLAMTAYMHWLSDQRPYSHFKVPKLAEARVFTGVLQRDKTLKPSNEKIVVDGNRGYLRLGCDPNSRIMYSCMPLRLRRQLAGQQVTVHYFHFKDARYNRNVVLQIEAGGTVYVSYDERLQHLLNRAEWQKKPPAPKMLYTGLFLGLVLSFICEAEARRRGTESNNAKA